MAEAFHVSALLTTIWFCFFVWESGQSKTVELAAGLGLRLLLESCFWRRAEELLAC